jgi:hypothetical protein
MSKFNNFNPPTFPNPLAEIWDVMRGMGNLQNQLVSEIAALRCAVQALCLTHQAPAEALRCYMDQMDTAADALQPQRAAQYGQAMQQFRDTLSAAVAARNQ